MCHIVKPLITPGLKQCDKEFQDLLDLPGRDDERRYVVALWKKFRPYADKQFKKELAMNFHSRLWEMYLTCALLDQTCFELIPKTWEKGPDVCLKVNNIKMWIEAVAPSSGEGPDAIDQPKSENGQVPAIMIPEEKIILRYLTAISTKHSGYVSYLKDGIINKNDPYIVAINGARVPYSRLEDDVPYIVKAVLPFGHYVIDMDFDTNEIFDQRYTYRPEIAKKNNSTVSTRSFLDKEYSGISGILFSNSGLFNRYQMSGTEFIFIHNPLADNCLSRGWLPIGQEYWVDCGKLNRKNWNK